MRLSELRSRLVPPVDRRQPNGPEERQLFIDVLRQAQSEVSAWHGRLYLVYLPSWEAARRRHYPDDEALVIAREIGVAVIDLREVFAAHKDPLDLFPLRRRGHYNARGTGVVAAAILEQLEEAWNSGSPGGDPTPSLDVRSSSTRRSLTP